MVEITLDSGAVVYDALFLALAEEAGMVVVTADYKHLQVLRGTPYARLAHYLADGRQPRLRNRVRNASVLQPVLQPG